MSGYWSEIITGGKSLVTGMMITAREFFKPVVTEQYPWEVPTMTPKFRGHIELIGNEETGAPNCIACGMCQRACPSGCITLSSKKNENGKGKVLTSYVLDFTKCSLCGSCVESCNFNALRYSMVYNLASFDKNDFIIDLMKRLEDQNICKR
ncbi:NADH-quinone oxidoreductase subunit I [Desulfobulbus rhabdoformis]|uniref:NuoI/complex I 23 kDa subunit family protein n=1 Tax=Desulfobulbus rhabdoformis TaxID=34032 RepID=UPI0019627CE0|nr:NADH-quinone oxidoreductase subunit I [Desulfobulbus rhabdoformis]MBM9615795.1 NADH-quinone oxidoreductase subunit I [Desulfobulbus rhabdoformis]